MRPVQYEKLKSDDECYTYPNLIVPLLPFIEKFRKAKKIKNKEDLTIWCPFDLSKDMKIDGVLYFKSFFVDIFEKEGYKVISSHILMGQDFFDFEPNENWDIIISNPPFKNKKAFFMRAISFKKPFALLSPSSWLNDSGTFHTFKDIRLQLLIPDKRACFFNQNGKIKGKVSFKSIYYCYDFLQEQDIDWFKLETW